MDNRMGLNRNNVPGVHFNTDLQGMGNRIDFKSGDTNNVGVETLIKSLSDSVNSLQSELKNKLDQLQDLNYELKRRKDFISSVTSILPEIIFVHDYRQNKITYSNKCLGKFEQQFSEYTCLSNVAQLNHTCLNCSFREMINYDNNKIIQNGYEEGECEVELDGEIKWFKTVIKDFERDVTGNVITKLHVVTDVTLVKLEHQVLKNKEIEVVNSLKEKELLLQEVHHRVKNNLQIIISMIYMKINRTDNDDAKFQLKEIINRIHSISLIHEELYQNNMESGVSVSDYIMKLGNSLSSFYSAQRSDVDLIYEVEANLKMSLEKAIPFGLLANELICNCYKHAFTDGMKGQINIKLYEKNTWLYLEVRDNGRGLPSNEEMVERKKNSLGMKLISGLVTQLGGSFKMTFDAGFVAMVEIKNEINL